MDHHTACARKRQELADKLNSQTSHYADTLTEKDQEILGLSLSQLVSSCNDGAATPSTILEAYAKQCVAAHAATNCLADLMFDEAPQTYATHKPLSGVPISLKDCIDIQGHDTTLGFTANVGHPAQASAPIVRLLQDAGALLHVKTTVPTGLLSFETCSDLFGYTSNPYNPEFSPGASTGGGAALLAFRGSKIEIGTDIGGSTRLPPASCGLYSVKASVGRFPGYGCVSCAPGMEAVQIVTSPLARGLPDLVEFWKRVIDMQPWQYDHTCVPVPWRPVDFVLAQGKPKWGVIWDDGVITPTPACTRALTWAVDALKARGHEVVDFQPPSPLEGLKIGFELAFSDGAASILAPLQASESVGPALQTLRNICRLPMFVKRSMAFFMQQFSRPAGRNDAWAEILVGLHTKTPLQERALVVQREEYKAAWRKAWTEQGVDFVLTVPHALPPMPKGGSGTSTLVSSNYCFLYNILDYAAGIVPVTSVDKTLDGLPADFEQSEAYGRMNDVARGVYSLYDPNAMNGLPLAVQVVGGRLEEEKVLEGMQVLDEALRDTGRGFVQKEF